MHGTNYAKQCDHKQMSFFAFPLEHQHELCRSKDTTQENVKRDMMLIIKQQEIHIQLEMNEKNQYLKW